MIIINKKLLSPIKSPSRKNESITEITKVFLNNVKKVEAIKKKTGKSIKLNQNFNQKKKKKYRRDQLNFKTPPPVPDHMTIDPSNHFYSPMNSFNGFSEEPEGNYNHKGNLNILKESISKLSIDFAQDRQFLRNLVQSNNKRNKYQAMSGSPFVKSVDAFNFDQIDSKLPLINQSTSIRNAAIKSPVMASIRMSRQNKSNNFASLQKFRPGGNSLHDGDISDCDKSDVSNNTNVRASYAAK